MFDTTGYEQGQSSGKLLFKGNQDNSRVAYKSQQPANLVGYSKYFYQQLWQETGLPCQNAFKIYFLALPFLKDYYYIFFWGSMPPTQEDDRSSGPTTVYFEETSTYLNCWGKPLIQQLLSMFGLGTAKKGFVSQRQSYCELVISISPSDSVFTQLFVQWPCISLV